MTPYYVTNLTDIRNAERTGYPSGEPHFPHCPFCGAACKEIKYDHNGDAYACDVCEKSKDAWDEPLCFPDAEE